MTAPGVTLRDARGVLDGGHVDEWAGPDDQLDTALITAIHALDAPNGHLAVITRTNTEANRFLRVLKAASIPIQLLEDYDGTYVDVLKVGTVQRAKGLEFPAVFRPVLPGERPRRRTASQQDTDELAARRQLVAVTRARDYLWLGIADGALSVIIDNVERWCRPSASTARVCNQMPAAAQDVTDLSLHPHPSERPGSRPASPDPIVRWISKRWCVLASSKQQLRQGGS
ncbi:hypothetical protein [Nocardia sp. CA-120079]|uniref:hypothetical protein n=1 Tax=Nocardia sp. CA-120079 TaxID=3239974 RepID=UPI003D997C09